MVAIIGSVASRPDAAASAAARVAATMSSGCPLRARSAGYQASSIVFSPSAAFPRATRPPTPASTASASEVEPIAPRSLRAPPMRRRKVP